MTSALPDAATLEARKSQARAWFERLRDNMCAALEAIEDALPAGSPLAERAAGRFKRTPWQRTDHSGRPGGGGVMAMMSGRVFEKVGVHCSTVHGEFAPEFRKDIPGADTDPRFWASGISLIAHPHNPHAPTAHMNIRFVVTAKAWFGGGGDLTPVLDRRRTQDDPDTLAFHAAYRDACERHAAPYNEYKKWCDEYFWLKHRNEPRGVGGIFYDDFAELSFDSAFDLVKSVGDHFLTAYVPIVERRRLSPFGEREREFQAYRRGRYV